MHAGVTQVVLRQIAGGQHFDATGVRLSWRIAKMKLTRARMRQQSCGQVNAFIFTNGATLQSAARSAFLVASEIEELDFTFVLLLIRGRHARVSEGITLDPHWGGTSVSATSVRFIQAINVRLMLPLRPVRKGSVAAR